MPDLGLQDAPPAEGQEQSPEEQYGDDFRDLPEERVAQLRSLCQKFTIRDQWARQIELIRVTLARFFSAGKQHVSWNSDVGEYQVGPSGAGTVAVENMNEEQTYMEDFNIYTGYQKSFQAVFAQNAASVRMEPDDPKSDRSIRAAREADKYRRVYEKYNPPKAQQIDIGWLLWTDGRVVSHTRYVENGSMFGYTEDEDGNKQPRGQEVTDYYGVLEAKVPIVESEFAKWPYCKVSTDHDICTLKDEFDWVAEKLVAAGKNSNANDEIARMARISTAEGVTQLSQDSLAHLGTKDQWWLRPAAFMELEESQREFFQGLYPDGCYVTFVGQTYCMSRNESMDDALAAMQALSGKGWSNPALGDSEIPLQMEFNDAMNLAAELMKYAIPSTWVDVDKAQIEAIKEQMSRYGEYRPFKRPTQEAMETFFFQESPAEAPAILPEWMANIQGPLSQFVTGQMPSVFGGNLEDQKTARGYQMARDQALGLMVIVWVPFKDFYSRIVGQAARWAAKRDKPFAAMVDMEGMRGKQETVEIDVENLNGGFVCSPQTDENFPESWTAKSNKYQTLLTMAMGGQPGNPLAQIIMQPDNLALGRDLYGLEDLVIPGADERDKQLAEIAELVIAAPVLDQAAMQQAQQQQQQALQQAQASGVHLPAIPAPAPIQPAFTSSVPVDAETDNHAIEAAECLRWINSPEGQQAKVLQPEGFANVRLHFLEHKKAMQAQQAQQAALAPPPQPAQKPAPTHPPQGAPNAPTA